MQHHYPFAARLHYLDHLGTEHHALWHCTHRLGPAHRVLIATLLTAMGYELLSFTLVTEHAIEVPWPQTGTGQNDSVFGKIA